MCARRSKTIHLPSGEMSTDIQVPSEVSKSMSRVLPRARVVSHFAAGLSFSLSFSSARVKGAVTSDAARNVKRKIARRAGRSELMLVLHGYVVGRPQRTGQTRSTVAEERRRKSENSSMEETLQTPRPAHLREIKRRRAIPKANAKP